MYLQKIFLSFCVFILSGVLITNTRLLAQDEECCEEDDKYGRENEVLYSEWKQQVDDLQNKKDELTKRYKDYNEDLNSLKAAFQKNEDDLKKAEENFYFTLGMTKTALDEFAKKFTETEKKISNRTGTPAEARKSYFNEIEASKAKCLPEYWTRYLVMKQNLEKWESESATISKESQYTVKKDDCLWFISWKKEHYGNPKFWPKIWDANKDGVISAPRHIPKTISNPNLIYPGQVLRIPILNQEDLKKMKENTFNTRPDIMKIEKEKMQEKMKKEKIKKDKLKLLRKKELKKTVTKKK